MLGNEEEQKCVEGLKKSNLAGTSQKDHKGNSLSYMTD